MSELTKQIYDRLEGCEFKIRPMAALKNHISEIALQLERPNCVEYYAVGAALALNNFQAAQQAISESEYGRLKEIASTISLHLSGLQTQQPSAFFKITNEAKRRGVM